MNTIFKYTMIIMGAYFTINWMADNPEKMNSIRDRVNGAVETGATMASDTVAEVTQQ